MLKDISFGDKTEEKWENSTINDRIMITLGERGAEGIMIERKDKTGGIWCFMT